MKEAYGVKYIYDSFGSCNFNQGKFSVENIHFNWNDFAMVKSQKLCWKPNILKR